MNKLIRVLAQRPRVAYSSSCLALSVPRAEPLSRLPQSEYSCLNGLLKRGMKRSANGKPVTKKPKAPDYCDVELKRDTDGSAIWPAPTTAIEVARKFIREW